jgi:nucleotide-binding universal stress UspA family protein
VKGRIRKAARVIFRSRPESSAARRTMIEIRRILCPIDFSDTSRRALDHALAVARWYHASVTVLHMHQVTAPVYVAPYIGPEALQSIVLTDLERTQLVTALNEYVAADRTASGVAIVTTLDESIDVPAAILSYAASTRADLVVLGTHGRSGFQRLVLGSVTEKVLRRTGCPVLTVPPGAADAVPRELVSIQHILCPIDFSPGSRVALDYAVSLAQQARARLTVLHVVELPADALEPPNSALVNYRATCFEQARAHMKGLMRATAPLAGAAADMVIEGRAYRQILQVAAEQQSSLIVMGVQGRAAVDMLFFGSTTNHVVRQATCPVLTLRAS